VFDDATFDLLASYQLGSNEIPNAVASMSFGGSNGSSDAAAGAGPSSSAAAALGSTREDEPPQFFIVGTAVIKPNVRHCVCCLQLCSIPAALPCGTTTVIRFRGLAISLLASFLTLLLQYVFVSQGAAVRL
jgi:hypothetical protein